MDEISNEKIFENLQVDFYRYMVIFGGIAPKTSRDYVSRLKFLAAKYRLDVFNGLLLAPSYDKLFDLGYITFKSNGSVVCSKLLSSTDKRLLMLDGSTRLQKVDDRHKPYLKYHNDQCFIG